MVLKISPYGVMSGCRSIASNGNGGTTRRCSTPYTTLWTLTTRSRRTGQFPELFPSFFCFKKSWLWILVCESPNFINWWGPFVVWSLFFSAFWVLLLRSGNLFCLWFLNRQQRLEGGNSGTRRLGAMQTTPWSCKRQNKRWVNLPLPWQC